MPLPAAPRRTAPPRKKPAKPSAPAPPPPELNEENEEPTTGETYIAPDSEIAAPAAASLGTEGEDDQQKTSEAEPHIVEAPKPLIKAPGSAVPEAGIKVEPVDDDEAVVDSPDAKIVTEVEPTTSVEIEEEEAASPVAEERKPAVLQTEEDVEPAAAGKPEVTENDEDEDEEVARRRRVAERLAKMGGINPFAPPPQRKASVSSEDPHSPPAVSPTVPRRASLRRESGDSFMSLQRKDSVGVGSITVPEEDGVTTVAAQSSDPVSPPARRTTLQSTGEGDDEEGSLLKETAPAAVSQDGK